ncbi:MAG: ATP-grasp domain-containing protein [Pseudonocardia sp.]|nr:ATP-grasp domain-containing protein [Pseudonocardia sp.]
MPTLLLIGVGRMGRPYLAAARRLGLRVCAVELPERAAPFADQLDELVECRGASDEMWAEAAFAAAHRHRPDGVVAFSEPQVIAAALVADEFGLRGPSLRAATLSRNKGLQRARFAAHGIGQPEHVVVERLAEAEEWAAQRFPVVVKPLSSAGSAGVELVGHRAAFAAAAARRDGEGRLLVERAVAGPEYSWEALVRDGQVFLANTTAKETTGPPHFVELAHRMPAPLDDAAAVTADALGREVVAAIGMRNGIVHLEFRLTADGPAVMEVAVRTPGDQLMELLGLAYGLDWFEAVVRLAMGLDLPAAPARPVRHAASYLPVAPAGTVVAVEGLDAVRAHPGVVAVDVSVAPGDTVAPLRSSADRVGEVLLTAPDGDELQDALAAVRRALLVRVSETPPGEAAGRAVVPAGVAGAP